MKTGKILILALLLAMCMALSSCSVYYRIKAALNDEYGVFFSETVLEDYGIPNAPMPNMDNALLRDRSLYLNLTDEEYCEYIDALGKYFGENKSECDLSLVGKTINHGIFAASECYYTPFDKRVLEDLKKGPVTFLYHAEEDIAISFDQKLPFKFVLERYPEEHGLLYTEFKYNTVIEIGIAYYKFEVINCLFGHTYDEEKEYIVPGEGRTVMSAKCTVCGIDSISEEIFSNEYRWENMITDSMVLEAAPKCSLNYLRDTDRLYKHSTRKPFRSDGICEVQLENYDYYTYIVKVNGEEIPIGEVHERYTSYFFAAPGEDANVVIYCCIAGEPRGIFLGDKLPWLFDVRHSELESFGIRRPDSSSAIDFLTSTVYYDEPDYYLYRLSNVKLSWTKAPEDEREEYVILVHTKDGSVYEADISGGLFFDGEDYYVSQNMPELIDEHIVNIAYSLDTVTGEGTVFGADGTELGRIGSVNELEFERCDGAEYASLPIRYTVRTESGDICAVNDTVFYICDRYGERQWFELKNTDFYTLADDAE